MFYTMESVKKFQKKFIFSVTAKRLKLKGYYASEEA
ncbi:MAG: hypothetical protein K0Q50_1773 [Vampirovibrio sp.]|jgi:hypothetical protein|nr:hypothetical protein [Vampirovibrio sp.]